MLQNSDECAYNNDSNDTQCQFTNTVSRIIVFEGKKYCEFHLPLQNTTTSKSKLFSEKHHWKSKQLRQFKKSLILIIKDAIYEQKCLNLSGVVFPEEILFDTILNKFTDANAKWLYPFPPATFKNAIFGKNVSFDNISFGNDIDFKGTSFRGSASFVDAYFNGFTNFSDALFCQRASFKGAGFYGNAWFTRATFKKSANFSGDGKHKNIKNIFFKETAFHAIVNFSLRKFIGTTSFFKANFKESPNLNNTFFSTKVNIEFAKYLNKRKTTVSNEQHFSKQFMEKLNRSSREKFLVS